MGALDPRGLTSSLFSESACGRTTSDYLYAHCLLQHQAFLFGLAAHNADGIIKDVDEI